ncbi:hypothetical protein MXB_1293 [Myxobolus squamalis]|nr:hypothetical protein MXB_1293 [Myxobolus squamalis]
MLYISSFATAIALYPMAKGLILNETQCFLKTDYNLCDLLCRCCKNGSKAEFARLIDFLNNRIIKKGADVNCRHSLGWCPLHSAAANGNVDKIRIARELIENGADVNALDEFSGILKVSARAHLHPVNVAETRASDFGKNFSVSTDFTGFTPIHYAVFLQNSEMIRLLLNAGKIIR